MLVSQQKWLEFIFRVRIHLLRPAWDNCEVRWNTLKHFLMKMAVVTTQRISSKSLIFWGFKFNSYQNRCCSSMHKLNLSQNFMNRYQPHQREWRGSILIHIFRCDRCQWVSDWMFQIWDIAITSTQLASLFQIVEHVFG